MNHERHEAYENSKPHGMRLPSPLSAETERVITDVIGCAIEVHKALGPGFLESIYTKAMCIELEARRLPYERERAVSVVYRRVEIRGQRVDLIVASQVVVEVKAITRLEQIHHAQLISYLRTTGIRAGLLINFRVPMLAEGLRRIVL